MTPDNHPTPAANSVPGVDRALIDDVPELDVNADPAGSPHSVLIVPEPRPRRRLLTAGPILFLLSAGLLVLAVRLPALTRPARSNAQVVSDPTIATDTQPSQASNKPADDTAPTAQSTDSAIIDVSPLDLPEIANPTATDPSVVATVHIKSPLDHPWPPDLPPLAIGAGPAEVPTVSLAPLVGQSGLEGRTTDSAPDANPTNAEPVDPTESQSRREDLTDQAWADIRRESERIAAERASMSNAKAIVLEQEALAKHQEAASKRTDFLERLRALADRPNGSLKPLTREAPRPDILNQNEQPRLLALSRNRSLRMTWIVRLRAMGIEESAILDELGRAHALNANLRGGPATFNDALHRAASEILASPTEVPPLPQTAKPPVARDGGRRLTPPTSSPASSISRRRIAPG